MDDARENVRRLMKSGSFWRSNAKKLLPILFIPARVFTNDGYEGLGMVAGESMVGDPMLSFVMEISSMGMIVFASVCTLGVDCNLLPIAYKGSCTTNEPNRTGFKNFRK